jgi:hypothetical protein
VDARHAVVFSKVSVCFLFLLAELIYLGPNLSATAGDYGNALCEAGVRLSPSSCRTTDFDI